MRTPLALLNLWNDKPRTAVAIVGTAFAVVLVLMQLGFLRAVVHTATLLYEQMKFDAAITSVNYRQMLKPGIFSRDRLETARSVSDVVDASPISLGLELYRNPQSGLRRGILVVGVDPRSRSFENLNDRQIRDIATADQALLDELSRPEYGERFPGLRSQIGDHTVTVSDLFRLGTGFGADGTVIVGDKTFARLFAPRTVHDISLGLLTLRAGTEPEAVVAELRRRLPPDVSVLTRSEFLRNEETYWVVKTSVGVIFGLGVVVAVLVGMAIVYQVLSADIAKRMPEYATLKAMGYPSRYLSRVILQQAAVIGAVGFVPGYFLADALYAVTRREANLWMEMGTFLPTATFVLSVAMCCASGLASLRKVRVADPAELFA